MNPADPDNSSIMKKMQLHDSIIAWVAKNIVAISIGIVLILVLLTNFRHARYNQPGGVIEWDVKSYYAWLPAVLIHNDLSLEFRSADIDKYGELIWPVETPTGKQAIVTTMGMAFLYSPFFVVAHIVSLITPYEADGYSLPYRFALTFAGLFYLWAGLLFLKRVLCRYFSNRIVAATIIALTLGTNLFYYATHEAAMTHVYNFALIAGFIWLTIRFYEKPGLKTIVLAGLMAGLITLIRPVNIIVLLIFFLWDITNIKDLRKRVVFFAKHYSWIVIMTLSFILVWVPQFIYWHRVSGQLFYFSYGELGGRFFFGNPQIFNILFSIKKGWLVYTPIMLFSLSGIILLIVRREAMAAAVTVFMVLNIYILSSWWNWWYGGGFGLRSFVDSYALLAIPFAAFLDFTLRHRRILLRIILAGAMTLLIFYNLFQTRQYVNNAIHWWWMNPETYRETFLKLHPTGRFWELVTIPDHDLARQGIYKAIAPEQQLKDEKDDWRRSPSDQELIIWIMESMENEPGLLDSLHSLPRYDGADTGEMLENEAAGRFESIGREHHEREWALELIIKEMEESLQMKDYIRVKAAENKIPFDSMLKIDAVWIYENQR